MTADSRPPVDRVLDACRALGHPAKPTKGGWIARCQAHDDRHPSLSIGVGDDGRALLNCHAGCEALAITRALGLSMSDLMPPRNNGSVASIGRSVGRPTFASAADALASLRRHLGQTSHVWTYTDQDGCPVGLIARWDKPGGKDIRPISRIDSGDTSSWVLGGMPAPRPLYALTELAAAECVYVCEGEKAADAVRSVGLTATTSPHGSQSAAKADWSPLAGKRVVILPDADEAGAAYAQHVARLLASLEPPAMVEVADVGDEGMALAEGEDIADAVAHRRAAGDSDQTIRAWIESLATTPPDTDDELSVSAPSATTGVRAPMPTWAFPEPVRSFIEQGAVAIGCDPSYIALPLLSSLAAAIGNTRRIELKRGWTEPAIVWSAIVGESGTAKTPAFDLALSPARRRQAAALVQHQNATETYNLEKLHFDKAMAAWKRSKRDQGDPPPEPKAPQGQRFIVGDTTVEALAPLLLANPRGLLVARDELAGWFGSFDRYAGGKGGTDAANWLSMHTAQPVVVDRKWSNPSMIYVPQASVSICGGIQPGILKRTFDQEHRDSGLAARVLLAKPLRTAKQWTEACIDPDTEEAVRAVMDRLYDVPMQTNADNVPEAVILPLTAAAKAVWIEFYNAHAREQVELESELSSAWSKLESYTARFALVIHMARWAADDSTLESSHQVDQGSIVSAIALTSWFGQEARRVYAEIDETDEQGQHRRALEAILRQGGSVSVRDWQRQRSLKSTDDSLRELAQFAEAGWGRFETKAPSGKGGRPSKLFVLNGVAAPDNGRVEEWSVTS